jgi:hypothetical protein
MTDVVQYLPRLLLILVALAPIGVSVFFAALALRQPIGKGKITCFVLSALALLPIVFLVLLAMAVQDD